ncbi:MAG TPA: hypothetical protein VF867_18785 [Arthrobacter sp.]
MPGIFRARAATSPAPAVIPAGGVKEAADLAAERYSAARREYTHLYVEFHSTEHPGAELTQNLDDARAKVLALAGNLPKVLAGDPDSVRHELEMGPAPVTAASQVTDRFRIADLHRAATDPSAEVSTWGWKLPAAHAG